MNQRIGYARVSTDDQHLELQRDALSQAGCSMIYEETISGKSAVRPELEQCRKALRAGDTLVVWRLDRLGRSLPDLVQIIADLEQRGRQVGFSCIWGAGRVRAKFDSGTHPSRPGRSSCTRAGGRSQAEAGRQTDTPD